jgi:hypothetical protein
MLEEPDHLKRVGERPLVVAPELGHVLLPLPFPLRRLEEGICWKCGRRVR